MQRPVCASSLRQQAQVHGSSFPRQTVAQGVFKLKQVYLQCILFLNPQLPFVWRTGGSSPRGCSYDPGSSRGYEPRHPVTRAGTSVSSGDSKGDFCSLTKTLSSFSHSGPARNCVLLRTDPVIFSHHNNYAITTFKTSQNYQLNLHKIRFRMLTWKEPCNN